MEFVNENKSNGLPFTSLQREKNRFNFAINWLYMNWLLIIVFAVAAISLIAFLVVRNQKDEKEFENQLKNDYRKTKDEEGDIEIDKTIK